MKKLQYITLALILTGGLQFAQEEKKDEKKKEAKKEKSFEEVTKQSRLIEGLFDIYQDTIFDQVKLFNINQVMNS